jgi:hypothetical protein
VWRGTPNPTVDAAWDNLDLSESIQLSIAHHPTDIKTTLVAAMSISKEEIERVGKLRNSSVRLPDGGYMASLAAFHQMHCLVRTSLSSAVSKEDGMADRTSECVAEILIP